MSYEDHIKNLRGADSESARLAYQFYLGNQLPYIEKCLNDAVCGVKNWKTRKYQIIWENLTQMIIDRSAQTYKQQPERQVLTDGGELNENATAIYLDLIKKGGFRSTSKDADSISRLLKTSLVLVQYSPDTKKLYFNVLSQDNCDVRFDPLTKKIISLLYTANAVADNGDRLYHYWTPEYVMDISFSAETQVIQAQGSKTSNPYGIVPVATLHDLTPPRFGFWSDPVWEQLTAFNMAVNYYHMDTKFNHTWAAFGTLFTNSKIKDGSIIGADTVVEVENPQGDESIFVDFKVPSVSANIDAYQGWLENLRDKIGEQWGVTIKAAGEGSADSGFKLIVEELPNLELREDRTASAEIFETDLYRVISKFSDVHKLGLPLSTSGHVLKATFPAPKLPVNKKEEWEIDQAKIVGGLMSREDYWKKDNPGITPEEIAEKIKKIESEKRGAAPLFANLEGT